MVIIAHRGNLNGRQPDRENKPDYIHEAIEAGFDVEVDVWMIGGEIYLGHDFPETRIDDRFFLTESLWCHAKNIEALHFLLGAGIHCFFHNVDDVVLTSRGFMWTFPGRGLWTRSVAVVLDDSIPAGDYYGICTDFPIQTRGLWQGNSRIG